MKWSSIIILSDQNIIVLLYSNTLMLQYPKVIVWEVSHINIGTGKDCSILELSELISEVIDFKGDIITDTSKPDGMPKKLLDVSLLAKLGWEYKTNIREGLEKTYEWFLENQDSLRSKENFSSSKIT